MYIKSLNPPCMLLFKSKYFGWEVSVIRLFSLCIFFYFVPSLLLTHVGFHPFFSRHFLFILILILCFGFDCTVYSKASSSIYKWMHIWKIGRKQWSKRNRNAMELIKYWNEQEKHGLQIQLKCLHLNACLHAHRHHHSGSTLNRHILMWLK